MLGAFEQFVAARGGVLWRACWLLTLDADRAEQLLGDALARTWTRARDIDIEGGTWEEHAFRELVRAYVPRGERADQPTANRDWSAAAEPPWTADEAEVVEERVQLLVGLGRLTPRQRAVLVLVHAECRTPLEAAAVLGCDIATVDSAHAGAVDVLRAGPLLVPPGARRSARPGVRGLDATEEYWLRTRLREHVPTPPYAPDRGAVAAARGRRGRRRALLGAGITGLALVALLTPAVLGGSGEGGAVGTGAADDEAVEAAGEAEMTRRLVDPLPIPDECADLPAIPPAPDLPLDLDLADAAWLRFCPLSRRATRGSLITPMGFAPDTTVVSGLDDMVEAWVSRPGSVPCPYRQPVFDGATRLQFGTADGQTHVVDLTIGACGAVFVDRVPMAVSGRRVFADAVRALGRQLGAAVDQGPAWPGESACPADPARPRSATLTTVRNYPAVSGAELPLPAVGALVCRYAPAPGGAARLTGAHRLGPTAAEQIRTAYLARSAPTAGTCRGPGSEPMHAVVLTDRTGSWRAIGVDLQPCGRVLGPGGPLRAGAVAGHWLTEAVRYPAAGL